MFTNYPHAYPRPDCFGRQTRIQSDTSYPCYSAGPKNVLVCPNAFLQAIAGSNEGWPAIVENHTDSHMAVMQWPSDVDESDSHYIPSSEPCRKTALSCLFYWMRMLTRPWISMDQCLDMVTLLDCDIQVFNLDDPRMLSIGGHLVETDGPATPWNAQSIFYGVPVLAWLILDLPHSPRVLEVTLTITYQSKTAVFRSCRLRREL